MQVIRHLICPNPLTQNSSSGNKFCVTDSFLYVSIEMIAYILKCIQTEMSAQQIKENVKI